MGNGYDDRPTDPLERLMRELEDLRKDVRELQRPTGTQIAQTVATLADLVLSATDRVTADFETGTIPSDVVWRYMDGAAVARLRCPTGHMTVNAGVIEARASHVAGNVGFMVTFEVTNVATGAVVVSRGTHHVRGYAFRGAPGGGLLAVGFPVGGEHLVTVPADQEYDIRVFFGSFAGGDGNSVRFSSPYVIARVMS